jgi:hypothetical protein
MGTFKCSCKYYLGNIVQQQDVEALHTQSHPSVRSSLAEEVGKRRARSLAQPGFFLPEPQGNFLKIRI